MDNCPKCNADLQGDPIPEESREFYRNKTHFNRAILTIPFGDVGLFWECPDCTHRWHRWPTATKHYWLAEPYVEGAR